MDEKVKQTLLEASKAYTDNIPLRAVIQAIPSIGGPLDTMFSWKGVKVQNERLEHFFAELSRILQIMESVPTFNEQILCDLVMDAMEKSVRTRTNLKRTLYANVVAQHVIHGREVDQSEMALRIIYELDLIHFEILREALQAPVCDEPFSGLRIVSMNEHVLNSDSGGEKKPVVLVKQLPTWPPEMIQFAASELVSKGLLFDEGIGRYSTKSMEYFVATDTAYWVNELISDSNST